MKKISVTIDVSKIDKSRIVPRTFTTRDGQEVTVQEYKIDLVPLKEPKTLKTGSNYLMKKTYGVAEKREKEEESNWIGEGITFHNTDEELAENYPQDDIKPEDIPF